ncbi:hypothetical protein CYCD_10390 [Tenuifilaceae bacterium CYCD]|nr:hypothetical protein CYCD_10390 [Tenuifilaceae bacterium CYCD]
MEFNDELQNDITQNIQFIGDEIPLVDPFPIKVFPTEIQEIIISACDGLNLPIDFFAGSILFAASIAIGNSFQVEIKQGWNETAALWIALVGNSGTSKSHPLTLALDPVFKKQSSEFDKYQRCLTEYEEWLQMPKDERERIGKTGMDKPTIKKYLLSDYTPEALVFHHQKNLRGMGVYSDELAGWINNFNRYNKGNEEQFWLSAWSGKPLITDRRGSGSFHVKVPFISVGGTIQTALIRDLAKGSKGKNGFIERLLFVFPDNLKKLPWSNSCWSVNQRSKYEQIIDRLLIEEPGIEDAGVVKPLILPISANAKKILWDWQAVNTELSNSTDNDQRKAIYAKLEVYAVRFSLIIHRLNCVLGKADAEVIDTNSITAGIILADYFRKNALKVLYILNNSSPIDALPKDKKKFYEALPEKFSYKQAVDTAKGYRFSEVTLRRLLANRRIFEKLSHGNYEKIF